MRIRGLNIRFDWGAAKTPIAATAVALALLAPLPLHAASKGEATALSRVDVQAQWASELPTVLTPADIATYKKIFAANAAEDWPAVEREIAKLKDRRLVGHVLAYRYLYANSHKATYAELAAWLKDYADHPDAPSIHAMALKRAPKKAPGTPALRRPTGENLKAGWFDDDEQPPEAVDETSEIADAPPPPGPKLIGEALGRASGVKGQISQRLRAGDLAGAENLLRTRETTRLLSDGEYDYWKARIAAGWFAQGQDAKALELAREAASRSGQVVPRANWIAGLSLFKQERFLEAARYFEALARTPNATPWDLAAGAFWTGRSYLQGRRPEIVNYWTQQAAEYPQTFYGLLAARTLSVAPNLAWEPPALSGGDIDSILRTASGSRAFALLQVGEFQRAEREFARLRPTGGVPFLRALLGVAMRAGMPSLSMRLGRELAELDGRRYDGALYPVPPYKPANGFEIDPALVYAVMRQESAFNPKALSPAGARGLMQLMPGTAQLMDNNKSFRGRMNDLYDPALNIALGQKYLKHLLDNSDVGGDLIRLAAAYNGGPGNLAKWKRKQDMRGDDAADDALLFIETLPAPETRHYITRVLYNYWMYSQRLGHPTPSLDLIASGTWPTYGPADTTPATMIAAAPRPPQGPQTAAIVPAPVPTLPSPPVARSAPREETQFPIGAARAPAPVPAIAAMPVAAVAALPLPPRERPGDLVKKAIPAKASKAAVDKKKKKQPAR
jgi:soluble lytic murein transglycosylase